MIRTKAGFVLASVTGVVIVRSVFNRLSNSLRCSNSNVRLQVQQVLLAEVLQQLQH